MAEISWIKLNINIFDDEKMKLIDSLPENDAIFRIWIYLLSLAGKTNDSGLVYLSNHIPYTEEMIASLCNRPISTVRLALKTFKNFGMIELFDDNLIAISNWEKHQNIDGLEKIREQNRKRQQVFREKQSNVTITLRNATEEEKNKKENKKKKREYIVEENFVFPDYLSEKAIEEVKKGSQDNYNLRIPIAYLNQVTGKSYKHVAKNINLIKARYKEGFLLDDFKKVIDIKFAEWWKDDAMNKYIRPETLFGTKFDGYLNQKPVNKGQGVFADPNAKFDVNDRGGW